MYSDEVSTLNEDLQVFENTRRESDIKRELEILSWHLNIQQENIADKNVRQIVDLVTDPTSLLNLPKLRGAFYLPIDFENEAVAQLHSDLLQALDTEISRGDILKILDPISRIRQCIPADDYIKLIDVVEAIRLNFTTQIFAERQMKKASVLIKNFDESLLSVDDEIVVVGGPDTIPEVIGKVSGKTYVFLSGPEDPYMDPYGEVYHESLAVNQRVPEKFLYFTIHERMHVYHDERGLKILSPDVSDEIAQNTKEFMLTPIEDMSIDGVHNRIDRINPSQKEVIGTVGGLLGEGTACLLTDLVVQRSSHIMPLRSRQKLDQVNQEALEALSHDAPPIYKAGFKLCRQLFEQSGNYKYLDLIAQEKLAQAMQIPLYTDESHQFIESLI